MASYSAEVLADSPLAYWKLDETSGTSAADSSGNGKTGTYEGSPTLGVAPLISVGTSVTFGAGKDVAVASSFSIPTATSPFTFEAWIKTTTTADRPIIAGRNSASGNADLTLSVQNGNLYVLTRDSSGGGLLKLTSPGTVNDGAAHHCVATRNSSKLWTLYIDGSSVTTGSDTMGTGVTNLDLAYIAFEGRNLVYFDNTIDEVAVYQTALSAARVLAHYNAGIAIPSLIVDQRRMARNTLLRV